MIFCIEDSDMPFSCQMFYFILSSYGGLRATALQDWIGYASVSSVLYFRKTGCYTERTNVVT